jgi:hypothetical protein
MTTPKLKTAILCLALSAAVAGIASACNDSAKKAERSSLNANDTIDTSQMDTATTRPVKTTNK